MIVEDVHCPCCGSVTWYTNQIFKSRFADMPKFNVACGECAMSMHEDKWQVYANVCRIEREKAHDYFRHHMP